MNALGIAAVILFGQLTLDVSPERLEPFSYTDEPLALRVAGLPEGRHTLTATLTWDTGADWTLDLGTVTSRRDAPVYFSIDAQHLKMGPVRIQVSVNGELQDEAATVYRIHRPAEVLSVPVIMEFETIPEHTIDYALESLASRIGVSAISDYSDIDFETIEALALPIEVRIDTEMMDAVGAVVDTYPETMTWIVEVGSSTAKAADAIGFLATLVPRPTIGIAPESTEALAAYLEVAPPSAPDWLVVPSGEDIHAFRILMEQSGNEFVKYRSAPTTYTESLMNGAVAFEYPALRAKSDETDFEDRARLNSWARYFTEYEFVGHYFTSDPIETALLRHASLPAQWLMALSTDEPYSWTIPESLQVEYMLSSSLNEYVDVPQEIELGPTPVFLKGSDPQVLIESLSSRVALELRTLTSVESYVQMLPGEVAEEINTLLGREKIEDTRTAFLAMLRSLPAFESRLIDEDAPVHLIVPIMARLSRVARLIAALSELQHEPFLEPSETMLTQSNRFVVRYMSRHPEVNRDSRAGQLVREISGLSEEASQLQKNGLEVEAAGVAMMALWRARALMIHSEN